MSIRIQVLTSLIFGSSGYFFWKVLKALSAADQSA